jgi:hypothetical protein
MKTGVFERLKHAQIGEPIHQPLILYQLPMIMTDRPSHACRWT